MGVVGGLSGAWCLCGKWASEADWPHALKRAASTGQCCACAGSTSLSWSDCGHGYAGTPAGHLLEFDKRACM